MPEFPPESATGAADDKARLRRALRRARRETDATAASSAARACADHLRASPLWTGCRRIALYLPNDGEMDTGPIVAMTGEDPESGVRELFLPRISGRSLEFASWDPGDDELVVNRYGIPEPATPAVRGESLDLFLVPLVGFATGGVRLGMGGGYYDRYLGAIAAPRRPWLIGLAYAMQRSEAIAADPWDITLDGVLTEDGLEAFSEALRGRLRAN